MAIENIISDYIPVTSGDVNELILRILFSLAIIIVGVLAGKTLNYLLKNLSRKLELSKHIRGSFIDLILVVIRWSIYIIFLNLALDQLGIPALTNFFTAVLITIPAFVGGIILVVIGFSIAYYLREIILNSEVKGANIFAKVIFYFVSYMFGVYSLKTALISFDATLTNNILLLFSLAFFTGTTYLIVKKD